jgi:DNA-binding HxlR family transcriptional regulator
LTLDVLGGKWKTIILARLKDKAMRYGDLRRAIPVLADKVLTQRLRELEQAGLVVRLESGTVVRYALSERGESLGAALAQMYSWGDEHGKRIGARFRTPPSPFSENE